MARLTAAVQALAGDRTWCNKVHKVRKGVHKGQTAAVGRRLAGATPVGSGRAAGAAPVGSGRAAGAAPVGSGRAAGAAPVGSGRAAGGVPSFAKGVAAPSLANPCWQKSD